MRELDKDGTGEIDYGEFARFLRSGGDKAKEPLSTGAVKEAKPVASTVTASKLTVSDRVRSELREKFDAAIESGKIASYEDVFKAMDKDGSGTVNRREFEDGLRDLRVCLLTISDDDPPPSVPFHSSH